MKLNSCEIVGAHSGPHLLITGGVHGDEFEPMAAVRRLMSEIDASELSGRLTLVPVVNEPAFRRGHRTGDDGLDLARACPGRADGSVTEQIAFELSRLIRSADFYIDLHTGGTRLMVSPLAGYNLHPDASVLAVQRRMARAFGLPIVWGTDPNLEGRSLSVARDAKVPAIYCEYLGGARCDPAGIEAYVIGCRNVMIELGLLQLPLTRSVSEGERSTNRPSSSLGERSPSLTLRVSESADNPRQPLIVEDQRPGAGHMQINHPSPCDGYFEPSVTLGQQVHTGDLLGTVCDPLGQTVSRVESRYTGVVIVLQTFPTVAKNESVAVVMEITCMAENDFVPNDFPSPRIFNFGNTPP